jgi:hypothetical protein
MGHCTKPRFLLWTSARRDTGKICKNSVLWTLAVKLVVRDRSLRPGFALAVLAPVVKLVISYGSLEPNSFESNEGGEGVLNSLQCIQ